MEPLDIIVIRRIFNERDKVINRAAVYRSNLNRTTERISQIKAEIQELQSELQASVEEQSRLSDCFKAYEAEKGKQAIREAECEAKLLDLAKSLPRETLIKIEDLYDAKLFCRWKNLAEDSLVATPFIADGVSEEAAKKMVALLLKVKSTPVRRRLPYPPPPLPNSAAWLNERFYERYDTGDWRQKKK